MLLSTSCVTSLDIAYPFLYHLEEDEAFLAAFPDPADRLDLHLLRTRCIKGHYPSNAGEGSATVATALTALFDDLRRMVRVGKKFNSPNADFQVWRLCDMFEKAVNRLERALLGGVETQTQTQTQTQQLQKKVLDLGAVEVTPVRKAFGVPGDDDMWNDGEEV